MALQALQSSGVAFRKILSHFPEELSLAFAYGSGVYRQAGPSANPKVRRGLFSRGPLCLPSRPPGPCLPALRAPRVGRRNTHCRNVLS